MTARGFYRNPRFFDRSSQAILFGTPIKAYTHRVRDIQTIEGRTFGWVRHQGGDWVVRLAVGPLWEGQTVWEVQPAMSLSELQQ